MKAEKNGGGGKRKTYPPEVRAEALRRMDNGEPAARVAEALGVLPATVYQWRYLAKRGESAPPAPPPENTPPAAPARNQINPLDSPFLGHSVQMEERRVVGVTKPKAEKHEDATLMSMYPEIHSLGQDKTEKSSNLAAALRGCRLIDTYMLGDAVLMLFLDNARRELQSEVRILEIQNGRFSLLEPERPNADREDEDGGRTAADL